MTSWTAQKSTVGRVLCSPALHNVYFWEQRATLFKQRVYSYTHYQMYIKYVFTTFNKAKHNRYLLSSLSVNRPIWGNSLNCSKQITPAHSILIIATWSCFTNLGLVFDFSAVFLSTRQMSALTVTSSAAQWMCITAE